MTIRLVLTDDHPLVREGLRALLESDDEFTVVGQAGDGAEVPALVEELHPDVVVLDLMMPGRNCFDVTRELADHPEAPPVLILSMHESEAYVLEALRIGAAGYVLKQAPAIELALGIRAVASGARYLSPPLTERALDAYVRRAGGESDPYDQLTAREREVLALAAEGHSNADIAPACSSAAAPWRPTAPGRCTSSGFVATSIWCSSPCADASSPTRPTRGRDAPAEPWANGRQALNRVWPVCVRLRTRIPCSHALLARCRPGSMPRSDRAAARP